jgi:protein-S-isoprenylcysteine O-methyltransferase Ste14
MDRLELKVPPLVVVAMSVLLMWVIAEIIPGAAFSFPGRMGSGYLLVFIGVGFIVAGIRSFRKAKTTVDPRKPELATSLVQSGIYKRTRNPIYLGLFFVLSGAGLFFGNYLAFLAVPLFVMYMTRFQILPEERALERQFPSEYNNYKSRVRRWI